MQDHDSRIRDYCTTQLFELYTCSQLNGILETQSDGAGLRDLAEQACRNEIEATIGCVKKAMEGQ